MSKLIAIDGDILVYSIAFSVEHKYFCCNSRMYKNIHTAKKASEECGKPYYKYKYYEPEKQIHINMRAKLNSIFEDLGTDNHIIYITSSKKEPNFRDSIATRMKYKGNREKTARPFYYKRIRNILIMDYGAIAIHGEEADDALGKLATERAIEFGNYEHLYIASIDKDLRMIPGYHYHLKSRELVYINEEEAMLNFYSQLIKGDAIDNIPGLYRLLILDGRDPEAKQLVKSRYLLSMTKALNSSTPDKYHDIVTQKYKDYGYTDKDINEIGQLLWIRRDNTGQWGKP